MQAPANQLERLLRLAAEEPLARPAFKDAVLSGTLFYVLTHTTDGRLSVRSWQEPDGTTAAAVFTSAAAVHRAFGAELQPAASVGSSLLAKLRSGPVYLDPGSPWSVLWTRQDIDLIIDGVSTTLLEQAVRIELGLPAEHPRQLLSALARELPDVARGAWLLLARRSDETRYTWMLGVEPLGPWHHVQRAVGRAIRDLDLSERPLDCVDVNQSSPGEALLRGIPVLPPHRLFKPRR